MSAVDTGGRSTQFVHEAEFLASKPNRKRTQLRGRVDEVTFCATLDGERYYPSFLVDETLNRRHFRAVARLLDGLDALTKCRFFVSGQGSSGGLTPLEALRRGQLRQVMTTAEGFAES